MPKYNRIFNEQGQYLEDSVKPAQMVSSDLAGVSAQAVQVFEQP